MLSSSPDEITTLSLVCFHAGLSLCVSQDSCGEDEQPGLLAVVKASPKPRRAKLLSKGRKLSARKRGRPKKAAVTAAERKSKKSQSALELLHAKTISAAPPQGEPPAHSHTHTLLPRAESIYPCAFVFI